MDLAPQRRLAAIMFTDIVGYSRLMGADEARAMRLLDRHDALCRKQVEHHRGRLVKTTGDGILATALMCGCRPARARAVAIASGLAVRAPRKNDPE